MILSFAEGRLGNQIFQYVFIKTIQKNNEIIVISGFKDLQNVFNIDDVININSSNKILRLIMHRCVKPFFDFLSKKRIISSITVDYEIVLGKYRRESKIFKKKMGILKNVVFIKSGFFQSEVFSDVKIRDELKIKDIFIKDAKNYLACIPFEYYKIFVHIRRGDYKDYTVYGKSTLLPMTYFHEEIKWFIETKSKLIFIFLSDDPEFIEDEFDYLENKLISENNHFGTDMAIMTLCDSGILSPSSYSWWGGYLMKKRDIVVCPNYWLGFNSKVEYHKGSIPSFARRKNII